MRVIRPLLACAALVLATALPARAQFLTLVLDQPLVSAVVAPTAVSFTGSLTNAGATPLFLNGASLTSGLNASDTPFFVLAPPVLAPGASVSGELFRVMVEGGVAPGSYGGTFYVLGGSTTSASSVLANASFEVRVVAAPSVVPEPGTSALVAGGLAVLAVARTRRRARRDS